jgi:hypothetical protein
VEEANWDAVGQDPALQEEGADLIADSMRGAEILRGDWFPVDVLEWRAVEDGGHKGDKRVTGKGGVFEREPFDFGKDWSV